MNAEQIIMSLSVERRKEMLESFTNKFTTALKEGNEKDADFYAFCCKVVAKCIRGEENG